MIRFSELPCSCTLSTYFSHIYIYRISVIGIRFPLSLISEDTIILRFCMPPCHSTFMTKDAITM
jgi:hypothetical protein